MFSILATTSKLTDALTLMIVGMGVVFGALTILLAVVVLINRLTRETSAPSPSSPMQDGQLVAVIAAAATAALGKHVAVRDIQPAEKTS